MTQSATANSSKTSTTGSVVALQDIIQNSVDDTVMIAVMGVTGSGKSTLINHLSGVQLKTSNSLHSTTYDIATVMFPYKGKKVVLIDTPGFDDSRQDGKHKYSDADILGTIAEALTISYNLNRKLNGIIYLHRITDPKIQGSAAKNIKMFRKLVGSSAMKNILLVTTMWEKEELSIGEQREAELKKDFWSDLIQLNARVGKHPTNSRDSAFNILDILMPLPPIDLKIQEEIVKEKKGLTETDAGVVLNEELAEAKKQFQKEKAELQKDKEEALKDKDLEWQKIIARQEQKINELEANTNAERARLKDSHEQNIRNLQAQLDHARNEKEKLRAINESKRSGGC